MVKPVASDVHDSCERNRCFTVGRWHTRQSGQSQLSIKEENRGARNAQPIELPIVCEFKDELVDHTVDANRATDKLKISICRIVEDEVVPIEGGQTAPSYTSSQLFNTVSKSLA
jgi:hypothetical protein